MIEFRSRSRVARFAIASLALAGIAATADATAAGPTDRDRLVHRRGGDGPVSIERATYKPDGLAVVRIDLGPAREELIPWDRVAVVEPPASGPLEIGIDRGLRRGDRLWRGQVRLRRGDARLAEEAFREALDLGIEDSPSLFAIAQEGLVAAAIMQGSGDLVQAEALFLGELEASGGRSDRISNGRLGEDLLDERLDLVPQVAPVRGSADLVRLKGAMRRLPQVDAESSLRRDLWLRLLEAEGPPEIPDGDLGPGTRFLLDLARVDASEPRVRDSARRRLVAVAAKAPAWQVGWIRHRLGRSAIRNATSDAEVLRGALDLVNVLALEDAVAPAMRLDAGQALVTALDAVGRDDEASTIRTMLMIEFPEQFQTETAP